MLQGLYIYTHMVTNDEYLSGEQITVRQRNKRFDYHRDRPFNSSRHADGALGENDGDTLISRIPHKERRGWRSNPRLSDH